MTKINSTLVKHRPARLWETQLAQGGHRSSRSTGAAKAVREGGRRTGWQPTSVGWTPENAANLRKERQNRILVREKR